MRVICWICECKYNDEDVAKCIKCKNIVDQFYRP